MKIDEQQRRWWDYQDYCRTRGIGSTYASELGSASSLLMSALSTQGARSAGVALDEIEDTAYAAYASQTAGDHVRAQRADDARERSARVEASRATWAANRGLSPAARRIDMRASQLRSQPAGAAPSVRNVVSDSDEVRERAMARARAIYDATHR